MKVPEAGFGLQMNKQMHQTQIFKPSEPLKCEKVVLPGNIGSVAVSDRDSQKQYKWQEHEQPLTRDEFQKELEDYLLCDGEDEQQKDTAEFKDSNNSKTINKFDRQQTFALDAPVV